MARQLGVLAARYLDERITDHAIVGVGWGSTVYHVVTSGYLRRKQSISSFSSWGASAGPTPDIDGGQVASRLGRALGGKVYYLQAPMVVTDAGVRTGLLRDQHIGKTLELARRANVLLVSVGAVTQASGIFRAGYLTEMDLEYPGQGAVGDICGVYFRQDGSPCSLELEERTIAAGGVRCGAPRCGSASAGAAKALPSIGAIRADSSIPWSPMKSAHGRFLPSLPVRSRNLALSAALPTASARCPNRLLLQPPKRSAPSAGPWHP